MSNNNSQMIQTEQTHLDDNSSEVGGEVAKILREIMQEMIAENVGIVGEQVTFRVTIHQGNKVIEDNKTIMRLPVGIQMNVYRCSNVW